MPVDPDVVRRSVDELMAAMHVDSLRSIRPVTHGLNAVVAAAQRVLHVDSVDIVRARENDAPIATRTVVIDEIAETRRCITGVGALVSAQVRVTGLLVANLVAVRAEPHRWTPDEVAGVETYAELVGALLRLEAEGDGDEQHGYRRDTAAGHSNRRPGERGAGTAWGSLEP